MSSAGIFRNATEAFAPSAVNHIKIQSSLTGQGKPITSMDLELVNRLWHASQGPPYHDVVAGSNGLSLTVVMHPAFSSQGISLGRYPLSPP